MHRVGIRAFRANVAGLTPKSLHAPLFNSAIRTFAAVPDPAVERKVVNVDRELPDPFADKKLNKRYFWVYAVGVTLLCALIFNYEKTRSPIINSVLYCLRRSDVAKAELGPNIGFQSSWPWIWGPLNTVRGDIDVVFGVRGDSGAGKLRLKASRTLKLVPFDVHHFTLETADGTVLDLMKDPTLDFEL